MNILDKKSELEQELKTLEKQIFDLETHYLEETQNTGNFPHFFNFFYFTYSLNMLK